MRAVLRTALLVMALLLLLVLAAPFSSLGTRLLIAGAGKWSPLDLEYGSGSLFGELRLERVALALDSLTLALSGLESSLDAGCLWQSRLCFRYLRAGGLELDLAGSGEEAAPGEPAAEELVPFPVDLSVAELVIGKARVSWAGGAWRSDLRAAVEMAGTRLVIDGARARTGVLSLAAAAAPEPDPEPAPGGRIELPAIFLPFRLVVADLALAQLDLESGDSNQSLGGLGVDAQWQGYDLQLHELTLHHPEWGQLALAGELAFSDDWPLALGADISVADAPIPARLQQRQLTLRARGSLSGLELAAVLAGSETVEVQADIDLLDRELPFLAQADGRWPEPLPVQELVALPAELSPLLLLSPLQVTASGNLERQRFELAAAGSGLGYEDLQLTLQGGHRDGELQVERLLLRDGADNALSASGLVRLGTSPGWDLQLSSSGFTLPEYAASPGGRLRGEVASSGQLDPGGEWRIALQQVDISGEVGGFPAVIKGRAGLSSDALITDSALSAEINGARLRLNAPQRTAVKGTAELTVEIADLGRWQAGSRGELRLRALLAPGNEDLQLSGSANHVAWSELRLDNARISGDMLVSEGRLRALDLQLNEANWAQWRLSQLSLTGAGDQASQRVELTSKGDVQGRLSLTGMRDGDGWRGTLQPGRLRTPLGLWDLPSAVALHWGQDGEGISVAAHCWHQGSTTRLCPGNLTLAERGEASIELDGRLDFLQDLLPAETSLSTTVAVDARASWSPEQGMVATGSAVSPGGTLRRHLGDKQYARADWQRSSLAFELKEGSLQLDSELALLGGKAALAMTLPAQRDQPLHGKLELGRLQLASINSFLPELEEIQGELQGDVSLSGTPDKPQARGLISLDGGRLRVTANPTQLENLQARLDLQGDRAELVGNALLGGGPLALAGELSLVDEPRLELAISGKDQKLLQPPSLEMTIAEELTVVATGQMVDVRGKVRVKNGVFEFEELPEGSVDLSRDVVIVDYQATESGIQQVFDSRMDIQLTIDDKFRISGETLNANVGGSLNLVQRPNLPLELFGNLNVIGGELFVFGQRLLVKRGTVSFVGPPASPELNLRAERNISAENITAGVAVRGPMSALELEVYSDPVMQQTEALSYLARGRGLDSGAGGGVDATALALSLGMGAINRSGLVSGLERLPGVRNVEFGTGQLEEDTTATVSGYLGERIYLSYGLGLNEPINVLTGRLYLQTRLWLEMVSALENSVDIYYSFDID